MERVEGENVGIYAINQGTLQANDNYTIAFTGANFAITKATFDPEELADGQKPTSNSLTYNATDQLLLTAPKEALPSGRR